MWDMQSSRQRHVFSRSFSRQSPLLAACADIALEGMLGGTENRRGQLMATLVCGKPETRSTGVCTVITQMSLPTRRGARINPLPSTQDNKRCVVRAIMVWLPGAVYGLSG